jgi:hypothetical protein
MYEINSGLAVISTIIKLVTERTEWTEFRYGKILFYRKYDYCNFLYGV